MILQLFVNLIITGLIWQQALVPASLNWENTVGGDAPNISQPVRVLDNRSLGVKVTAPSAIVLDLPSGEILFEKNSHRQQPIASLTKLMSALVFLENSPDFEQEAEITQGDWQPDSTVALYTGDKLSLRDLFYSSLAGSANNATMALMHASSLSEENFVKKMNNRARLLGLKNTYFTEPTGLDSGNVSTAYDIARLAAYALRDGNIKKAVTTTDYSFNIHNTGRFQKVTNTNKLLKSFLNITGGKTGFTDAANYCLASRIVNDRGNEIMVVVLGSASEESRFQEVKGLAWWTFENYQWQ